MLLNVGEKMETVQTLSPVRSFTRSSIASATKLRGERLFFFDLVRDVAMVAVVIYHAVAAYASVAPWWSIHDGVLLVANGVREVFDVFMMPVFFFVAGYFALASYQRRGPWPFLKAKFRELGFPLLLGILVIIPFVLHRGVEKAASNQAPIPFWKFWFNYLQQFGQVQMRPGPSENQMHFWFLSLLLAFFIAFAAWRVMARPTNAEGTAATTPASAAAILKVLIAVSVLVALASFALLVFVPSVAWLQVDLLLEFQVVSIILYVAYFALGIAAYSGQWFSNDKFPGRLSLWIPVGIILTVAFLLLGQGEFSHAATSDRSSPPILLAFALVRTFLCLAFLATLISLSLRYGSRPSKWVQNLADHSYNIYLVHIFFVVALQDTLMVWQGGPALVKAALVALVALPLSYGASKLIKRFPYVVVGLVVALFLAKFIGGLVLS
jgi:peptidoglycan/LPS O-acetylase OafA/YrhL